MGRSGDIASGGAYEQVVARPARTDGGMHYGFGTRSR